MTTTTSLELSKKLWENGLKIETEKWWSNYFFIDNEEVTEWRKVDFLIGNRQYMEEEWFPEYKTLYPKPKDFNEYPAYQTDELLAILPKVELIKRHDMYGAILGTTHIEENPSEALGKLAEWLLDNGYHYDQKTGRLEK